MSPATTLPTERDAPQRHGLAGREPGYGKVFWTQVRFLVRGNSGGLLLVLAALGAGWITMATWVRDRHGEAGVEASGILSFTWVLGLLIAYQTWDQETPRKRTYHRSQPVPETVHDLLRAAAGVVFLLVALAVVLAAELVGMRILAPEWIQAVPSANWLWAPGAALAAYAMGSVAAVGSVRPGWWMLGVPVAFGALSVAVQTYFEVPPDWVLSMWRGTIGVQSIVSNGTIFEPMGAWAPSILFWTGVGAAGTVLAAFRRRGAR